MIRNIVEVNERRTAQGLSTNGVDPVSLYRHCRSVFLEFSSRSLPQGVGLLARPIVLQQKSVRRLPVVLLN